MADMTEKYGTPVYDETEEYDRTHGRPTRKDVEQPTGLSEASNRPPAETVPFRVTRSS